MDWEKPHAVHHGQMKVLVSGLENLSEIVQAGGWRAVLQKRTWGADEEEECESAVCPCGETGPTAAGQGKWVFQWWFCTCQTTSGILCPVLGSLVQGRCWRTGASMIGVWHKTLTELCLSRRDIYGVTTIFCHLMGGYRGDRDRLLDMNNVSTRGNRCNCNKWSSNYTSGEEKFGIRVVKHWKGCPEGLQDLYPWRHSELSCQGLEQLDLSWPCSEQGRWP